MGCCCRGSELFCPHGGRIAPPCDDVLDDGTNATFYIAADRRIVLSETFLSHDAKEIVSKHSRMQYQIIGGEFPGRKTLQVQISFDFA